LVCALGDVATPLSPFPAPTPTQAALCGKGKHFSLRVPLPPPPLPLTSDILYCESDPRYLCIGIYLCVLASFIVHALFMWKYACACACKCECVCISPLDMHPLTAIFCIFVCLCLYLCACVCKYICVCAHGMCTYTSI